MTLQRRMLEIIIKLIVITIITNKYVEAHAVLRVPVPYNTNPTTKGPCGVDAISSGMASTPMITWTAGNPEVITWNLVASDGGGNLIGEFDPLGGTNFSVPAWTETYTTSGSNKIYNKTFIVPSTLDCSKSPTGYCTFRARTGGWVSCTTVKICDSSCTIAETPKEVCAQVLKPLTFCTNSSGVSVSQGYSYSDIDSYLAEVYTQNINNPLVFATPTDECKSLYKTLLCGQSLSSCSPSSGSITYTACKSQCQQTMKACSVTDLHIDLYQCDSMPECSSDLASSSSKKGMSSGGAAVLSIFLIALVGSAIFAGFMYHKQGHLFGYSFDKDSMKFVKHQANPHNYTAYVDRS